MLSDWIANNIIAVLSMLGFIIMSVFTLYYKFKKNLDNTQRIEATLTDFSNKTTASMDLIANTFHEHKIHSLVTNQRLESMIVEVKNNIESHKHDCENHKNQLHKDLGQIYERLNK